MATQGEQPRTIVDYNQSEQRFQDERTLKATIRDYIERCSKALGKGRPEDYYTVAVALRDALFPMMEEYAQQPLLAYDDVLADETGWNGPAFMTFRRRGDAIVDTLSRTDHDSETFAWRVDGYVDGQTSARETTAGALHSLAAIAAHEGAVADRFNNEAEAKGFAVKLGVHRQRPDMDFGDPVSAIRRDLGALKHFFTGGTSGGKSSGASRQFEDYYRASVGRGRNYKCLDPVGITTENVNAYDVPQQDGTLRHAREGHDLAPDWSEIDDYDPQAEFFVPLTPDLEDYPLPYDTAEDEFVPQPFTIPASDLSEGLLSATISARVSQGEERVIRQAYRDVERRHEDWSLYDLEQTIQQRQDLSDNDKESASRIVQDLASEGFIRTAADEYAFDDDAWTDLFRSTDVVTVFNQAHLSSDLSKYLVLAYLVDQIWTRRNRAHHNPADLVCWLRELHLVVPHVQHRRKMDDAVRSVIEHLLSVLNRIMRMPRDINTHVIADTQDPNDPEKGIRKRFNRYVVFGGSDEDLKNIFSWAGQNNWKSLKSTITGKPGHAGIIKGCEPAIGPNRWGISPVHLTPPSWHHHDKDEGPSGWQKRVSISQKVDAMHGEELRNPAEEWGLDAPERDDIAVLDLQAEEEAEDDEPEEPEEQFTQSELAKMKAKQLRSHTDKSLSDIAEDIPDNPDTGKAYTAEAVRGWVGDIEKGSGEIVLDLDL